MNSLAIYDQARRALATCRNVDEIKDIRDKSEAMRLYAKQAQDTELEQWAAEIKLRAQRAIGEISVALEKQKNQAALPTGGKSKSEALADAGISTSTANRYEKLAAIPEPVIEEIIAKSKEIGKPVSAKAVMAQVAPKASPTSAAPAPAASPEAPRAPSTMAQVLEQQHVSGATSVDASDVGDDAHDEPDPFEQLVEMNKALEQEKLALASEILALNDRIAILTRDDLAAAADEWKLKFEQLSGRNRQLQETAREAQLAEKRALEQLAKVRRALGVESNAEILPALTARGAA